MVKDYNPKRTGGTEFEGKMGPAGVHTKGENALTASEKMRLIYKTGQDKDTTKRPTNRSSEGLKEPGESQIDKRIEDERRRSGR